MFPACPSVYASTVDTIGPNGYLYDLIIDVTNVQIKIKKNVKNVKT